MEEAPGSHGNHHVFTVTSDKHLSVSLLLFFALYFHLNFRGFADMLRVDAGTAHRRTWTQQDIPVPRTGRQLFLYGKTPHPLHQTLMQTSIQHNVAPFGADLPFPTLLTPVCVRNVLFLPSGSRMLEQTNKDVHPRIFQKNRKISLHIKILISPFELSPSGFLSVP